MAEFVLAEREKSFSTAYQWYALGVLFIVYVCNFIDRSVLALLAQSIKEDLQISDTLLGLLGGFAFALFYTAFGIPIARLADKGNRRNILVACVSVWSAATALCGMAQSYTFLLLARIGVAVGEAGGSPPAHSMISDMFAQHRRATALGIYALGIPVGSMIGALAGGLINDAMSWRAAFVVVGLPGLLLAILVRFTLKEPPRGVSEPVRVDARAAPAIARSVPLPVAPAQFSLAGAERGFSGFRQLRRRRVDSADVRAQPWTQQHADRHGVVLARRAERDRHVRGRLVRRSPGRSRRALVHVVAGGDDVALDTVHRIHLSNERSLARVLGDDDFEHTRIVLARADVFADAGPRRIAHAGGGRIDHVVRAQPDRHGFRAVVRRRGIRPAERAHARSDSTRCAGRW